MRTYKITKNGYLLGKAKGKNNAVQSVIYDLTIDNNVSPQWHKANGCIVCLNGLNEYIIDIDKGD